MILNKTKLFSTQIMRKMRKQIILSREYRSGIRNQKSKKLFLLTNISNRNKFGYYRKY